MSDKVAATFHGESLSERLRRYAVGSDNRVVMLEAADALEAVAAIAETLRYKGEFGWSAWQEGGGPDMEGTIRDDIAGAINRVLEPR